MTGMIENALGHTVGFVTRPVGAAITAAALVGITTGYFSLRDWWHDQEAKDGTITELTGQVTELTGDLQQAELDAAAARTNFERREADLQNQVTVNAREATLQRLRAVRLTARIEALQNEETGPLSPVLVHALDSVRDDLRGFSPA